MPISLLRDPPLSLSGIAHILDMSAMARGSAFMVMVVLRHVRIN